MGTQRRKFSREFKLEAVRLIKDRGVAVTQAARYLDGHENVLRTASCTPTPMAALTSSTSRIRSPAAAPGAGRVLGPCQARTVRRIRQDQIADRVSGTGQDRRHLRGRARDQRPERRSSWTTIYNRTDRWFRRQLWSRILDSLTTKDGSGITVRRTATGSKCCRPSSKDGAIPASRRGSRASQAIKFLMAQTGLSQRDLIPYLGIKSRVSDNRHTGSRRCLPGGKGAAIDYLQSLQHHADLLLRPIRIPGYPGECP